MLHFRANTDLACKPIATKFKNDEDKVHEKRKDIHGSRGVVNLLDKKFNGGTFDNVFGEHTLGVNGKVLTSGGWVRVDLDVLDLEQVL